MRLIFSLLSLFVLGLGAAAGGAEPKTAAEIHACVEANLPKTSSVQTIALRAKDRVGAIRAPLRS